jgi:hypothetical protein
MSNDEKDTTLTPFERKQLLQDFEISGVSRADFALAAVCDATPLYYGEPGTVKRRAFQFHWNNLRRLKIDGYLKHLKKFKIVPGFQTQQELANKDNKEPFVTGKEDDAAVKEDDAPVKEDDSPVKEDASVEAATVEEEEVIIKWEELSMPSDSPQSIASPPPVKKTLSYRSPHRTPSRSIRPAGFQSPMTSPQPTINADIDDIANSLSSLSIGDDWPGSKSNPFVSPVDLRFPERSRDFDPQYIKDLPRRDFEWKAFHLRRTCPLPDHRMWTAVIPDPDAHDPAFAGRVILVKGPAQDFYQRNHDVYHQKMKCAKTKEAHDKAEINLAQILEESPERFFKYYLVVFPEGTELHNAHIAGSFTHEIPVATNVIPLERSHLKNPFSKDINGASIYWEIALKHGGQPLKRKNAGPKDEDLL